MSDQVLSTILISESSIEAYHGWRDLLNFVMRSVLESPISKDLLLSLVKHELTHYGLHKSHDGS